MPLQATSVRLDDETLHRIGEMAKAMDRPRAWLMAYAIKQFVAQAGGPFTQQDLAVPGSIATKAEDSAAVNTKVKGKKKGKKKNKHDSAAD